jgi:hypothetical protein
MPQVIAAAATWIVAAALPGVTAAGTAFVTSSATLGVIASAASLALQAAAYAGLASLAGPSVAAAEGRPTEWSADPDAPIPFIFGLRGVAGQIVHRDTFGPNNRYQGIVTVYSGAGPINAYGSFYVDSTARTFTGETMDGTPTAALYRQTKTGAQPDTALTSPSVPGSYTLSGWGASHKLSGKACSMITLFQDGDFKRWPTGEPKVIQEIQGLLCYDPRLDSTYSGGSGACRLATRTTWVYSTNPIIHALNWALGMKENSILVGGIGASSAAIDFPSFVSAANVADTNSWTGSAVAYSLDDKFQVFSAMLQAGGAIPARKAGQISCISRGAAPSSVVTISAADTAGPFEFQAGAPREGRINTAIPRCVSSAHDWEMVDLTPVSSATYITEDGGATRSKGIDYPFVSAANQAAQLARYDIADSREGITGTIPLKPYMRDLAPGDAFTITEDGFAMSGQKCLVLSRSYDPASDVVNVTFRSETNSKHAWALAGTGTAPATPSLGYTDPNTVPTPSTSDWTLAAGTGGVPSLVITGAVPSTVNVASIVVEYKTVASGTWILFGEYNGNTVKVEIPGLTAATSHTARLSYRNVYGVTGSSQVLTATPTTGTVAGGGITTDTVDTAQLASKSAHAIGAVYSNSLITQVSTTSYWNALVSLTVTTTGDPLVIDAIVTDEITSGAEYTYRLKIDSGVQVEWAQKTGTSGTIKMGRSLKFLATGAAVAAGSHTITVEVLNSSGATANYTSRFLAVTELKKST